MYNFLLAQIPQHHKIFQIHITKTFGSIDVAASVPYQSALYPNQNGTTPGGSVGFDSHQVTIIIDDSSALWEIDGIPITRLDSLSLLCNVSIGYMDIFSSVSDNQAVSFGLIDNLVVTNLSASVPEPATILLMGTLFNRPWDI